MCGRINVSDHPGIQALLDHLGLALAPQLFEPAYNVAPGACLWAAIDDDGPALRGMVWGITPPWARDDPYKRLINAKAETVWDRASFKGLIRERRCVVPVNGFYEWQHRGGGRQAYHVHAAGGEALALAGIHSPGGEAGPAGLCLLTTAANPLMAPIHDRMPVILPAAALGDWLGSRDRAVLDGLMRPPPAQGLRADPVSSHVNSPRNQGPACVQPESPASADDPGSPDTRGRTGDLFD